MPKRKRRVERREQKSSSGEDKSARVLRALFILSAAQAKLSVQEIRKILGVAWKDINPIMRAVKKALKRSAQ